MKFKHPESANCQNANDVMDDGINRGEMSIDSLPESAMLRQNIRSRM